MNFLVLNGSPKGKYSITLQTSLYLEILHPEHSFEIYNVGAKIKLLEKDMSDLKSAIEKADVLVFSYPVYTFLATAQMHRLIELLHGENMELGEKYATQITTSKHFYDVTAHKYIEENCLDLGLRYVRGLSADMEDLSTEKGRIEAEKFFDYLMFSIDNGFYASAKKEKSNFIPAKLDYTPLGHEKSEGDVVIIADLEEKDESLRAMIDCFRDKLSRKSRIVNIRELGIMGGCLGCFGCAIDGKCVYKDGFDSFLRERIQTADSMVYAFKVSDHSMGAMFKTYDDRQFCNGHRTVTIGMPIGYLVSGKLSSEENLKKVLEARADVGNNFLAGVATDETDPLSEIEMLAKTLDYALDKKHVEPQRFYGIGGMKIFRDLIWQMRGMMRADHKFYKKHKQYDFPQKRKGTVLKMYLVGMLLSSKKIKAKMGNKMNEGMIAPYKKALDIARERVNGKS